jgi:lipid-binding SYLF domain-containing protein
LILAMAALPARAAAGRPAADAQTSAAGTERIDAAILAIKEMTELTKAEERLPKALLQKAQGMAIYPGVIKAAYGIGGQYGRGILMIRSEKGAWSNPVFVSLIGKADAGNASRLRASGFPTQDRRVPGGRGFEEFRGLRPGLP